jgi:hypothetical protein
MVSIAVDTLTSLSMASLPPGPLGVLVTHLIIAGICFAYNPDLVNLLKLKGWLTIILWISAIWALFKCSMMDPGIVRKIDDIENTPPSPNSNRVKLPVGLQSVEMREVGGEDSPSSNTGVVQTYTPRFCAICEVHQPLRTKHCEELNACIRTFDHYCGWLSNCVGELNRPIFLLYLICEWLCLAWFVGHSIAEVAPFAGKREQITSFGFLIFAISVMCIFLLMTGLLAAYHLFLCLNNLTTWEHSSWKRITYLKDLRPVDGSPFASPSVPDNIRMYLRRPGSVEFGIDGGVIWKMGPQHTVMPECIHFCCDI